jgi:hypothetical protein
MDAMFEDDLMEEELQEFILKMTPYPNGEGNQTRFGFSATHRGSLSHSWSQMLIKKI